MTVVHIQSHYIEPLISAETSFCAFFVNIAIEQNREVMTVHRAKTSQTVKSFRLRPSWMKSRLKRDVSKH